MHAEIELGYTSNTLIKELDDSNYERLLRGFPALDLPVNRSEYKDISYYSKRVVDLTTTGPLLTELGLEFSVKRFKSTYKVQDPDRHVHIHVAIPNIGLLMVDEVQLLDDACTHVLQGYLDEGWRILAVCPPAMQRRPDYILGRTKKDD